MRESDGLWASRLKFYQLMKIMLKPGSPNALLCLWQLPIKVDCGAGNNQIQWYTYKI